MVASKNLSHHEKKFTGLTDFETNPKKSQTPSSSKQRNTQDVDQESQATVPKKKKYRKMSSDC